MSSAKHLASLNPEQRQAVLTTEGPLLVLAGAGTGKTRVITVRIAHLLSEGVDPDQILAVTFTNKAAREMRERLTKLVGKKRAAALTVGTFHAFCVKLLREHAPCLGLPKSFTICDASDQSSTLKGVMRELHVADATLNPRVAHSRISLFKNQLVTPREAANSAVDAQDELVALIYERYDQALRRSRSLDFDDLLLRALDILRDHADVRDEIQERFQYVLVDEYQDTNGPQYEIVRSVAGGHRNLCVVGDDDQSIYGWRGADVSKILGFENDFPGAEVVRLETNYRSTEPILEAANRVIANNPSRHGKRLRSALGSGRTPRVVRFDDEVEEADQVVGMIRSRIETGEAKPGDIAILYRTQVQPRPIEAALRAAAMPYVLVGGPSFFDRKEIRDALAWIKLLVNPDDEPSLLRVVNRPPRGIGKGTIEKVLEVATERGISARRAFAAAEQEGLLSRAAGEGWLGLVEGMRRLQSVDPGRDLVGHVKRLLEAVDYRQEVLRSYPDERTRQERWQSVLDVLDLAENYVSRSKNPTFADFLERVALAGTDDPTPEDAERRGAITLMTMHAAKGLEYNEVYLVGAEEGLLPHARAVAEDGIEEERRLMYVGITRARARLTISWAGSRSKHGTRADSMPSRFLYEMAGEEPPENWVSIEQQQLARAQDSDATRGRGQSSPAAQARGRKRRESRRPGPRDGVGRTRTTGG